MLKSNITRYSRSKKDRKFSQLYDISGFRACEITKTYIIYGIYRQSASLSFANDRYLTKKNKEISV